MTWVDYITLGVSIATLLLLVYNSISSNIAKRKDRRISVVLDERRKMHNELFHHITSVLDLGRKSIEIVDKENDFAEQLRSHCNLICVLVCRYFRKRI